MYPNPPPNLPPDPPAAVPPRPPATIKVLGTAGLASLLAGMSMLGPFSIDSYLPAFGAIQASLHASQLEVQQTLTAFMLAMAAMGLWHGALADTFGRRNVMLVALVVFAVGTLGCAAAHSVHYLWVFRILQGLSAGAGTVVGRAIVRDLYSGAEAVRLLSLITMIFSIAPAVAPIFGGWIVELFDWRTIFLFLFAYAILLFCFCYRRLPETLPPAHRQPFNPEYLAKNYGAIFRSPLFYMKAGVVSANFGGLFLIIAAAPVVLPEQLGLTPGQFGWLFIPSVSGIFLGALLANRLAGKLTPHRQIDIGAACMVGAALASTAYHLVWAPALPWSVAPIFMYTIGMSLVAPAITMLALDLFPHIRGTVASCQSFLQTLTGAIVAGVIAPMLSFSMLALSVGELAFALLGYTLWKLSRAYRARHPRDSN